VIGGKVVASMERVNEKDFRSNVEQGGIGKKIELDKTVTEIAQTVAKTLNADYLGIDILFDGEEYYLCEANSNAFFKGITNATGIDVAEFYAKHILEKIN
jgi:glutathione synthase/RimK-type ligase-like ATP-grasp enzyme